MELTTKLYMQQNWMNTCFQFPFINLFTHSLSCIMLTVGNIKMKKMQVFLFFCLKMSTASWRRQQELIVILALITGMNLSCSLNCYDTLFPHL